MSLDLTKAAPLAFDDRTSKYTPITNGMKELLSLIKIPASVGYYQDEYDHNSVMTYCLSEDIANEINACGKAIEYTFSIDYKGKSMFYWKYK